MNVHVSYRIPKSSDLEAQINYNIEKLRKRLQVYKPDLVHLRASIDEGQARSGVNVHLDLRLPSGDIASQESADRVEAAVKGAFQDLIEQVTKHKARLRAHYQWTRQKRVERTRSIPVAPFEDTIAAVSPETASEADISNYVNANLTRLQRFVEREIRYRENVGELQSGQVLPSEVLGEAVANALGQEDRPEKLTLEPWLYQLALKAIRKFGTHGEDGGSVVPLEDGPDGASASSGEGSDESFMQFHQPDEAVTSENLIPDRSAASPEESAASDEMIGLVELALLRAKRKDREAFLLFVIEGFTVDEIAAISNRPAEEVRTSIKSAREYLRRNLPIADEFKDKLLQHSKIA